MAKPPSKSMTTCVPQAVQEKDRGASRRRGGVIAHGGGEGEEAKAR